MKKFGPSFLLSILLHVGLVLLAFITWQLTPAPLKVSSVPVTVISDMPSRQMAEAPVDELAVKTPEPIPQPEPVPPQPSPAPQPVPTPVQPKPVPAPPKPVPAPPKPVAKPTPAPPDKNGLKKVDPTPVKKPAPTQAAKPTPAKAKPQDDFLSRLAATPSQAPTKRASAPSTQRTKGISAQGYGPADAGVKSALDELMRRIKDEWIVNCDVPGSREVNPQIKFTLSPNGRVMQAEWINKRSDPVWVAGANQALGAVNKGQPYGGLPEGLYNRPIIFTFSAEEFCRGR